MTSQTQAASERPYDFFHWFQLYWSRVALPAAILLLLCTPWLLQSMGTVTFSVFVQLPIYMIHQYEEHAQFQFKEYVNTWLANGRAALNDEAIFWINVVGVWAGYLLSLYLASFVALEFGLLPTYLTLLNGLVHLLGVVIRRRYNPGAWTSLLLFLPVGSYSWYLISQAVQPSPLIHLLSFGVAATIHLMLIAYIRHRVAVVQRNL